MNITYRSSLRAENPTVSQESVTLTGEAGIGTKVVLSAGAGILGVGLGFLPIVGAGSNALLVIGNFGSEDPVKNAI